MGNRLLKHRLFNYPTKALKDDFSDWDTIALKRYERVLEKTIDEAHVRENVVYSRSGALLSLNGIILALICTFLGMSLPVIDSVAIILMTVSIVAFVASSVILGFVLIPPDRTVVDGYSPDGGYGQHKRDPRALERLIVIDRSKVCNRLQGIVRNCSYLLGVSIFLSTIGLWGIGSAMIHVLMGDSMQFYGLNVSLIIVVATLLFVITFIMFGIDRIIEDRDDKDYPHEEDNPDYIENLKKRMTQNKRRSV